LLPTRGVLERVTSLDTLLLASHAPGEQQLPMVARNTRDRHAHLSRLVEEV